MTKEKLTEKERRVYEYIARSIREEGFSPSVRDIQSALSFRSTSTVHGYLSRLEEKGFIRRASGKSRSIRLGTAEVADLNRTVRVPLIGRVAAGLPILASENFEGFVDYPLEAGQSADPTELFALRIRGRSMIEAGIMDGDVIVVRKTPYAENGQIVVALIGEEATVKTYYRENGHFRLQPENRTMEPIIVPEVLILGRVIADLRFY